MKNCYSEWSLNDRKDSRKIVDVGGRKVQYLFASLGQTERRSLVRRFARYKPCGTQVGDKGAHFAVAYSEEFGKSEYAARCAIEVVCCHCRPI